MLNDGYNSLKITKINIKIYGKSSREMENNTLRDEKRRSFYPC